MPLSQKKKKKKEGEKEFRELNKNVNTMLINFFFKQWPGYRGDLDSWPAASPKTSDFMGAGEGDTFSISFKAIFIPTIPQENPAKSYENSYTKKLFWVGQGMSWV